MSTTTMDIYYAENSLSTSISLDINLKVSEVRRHAISAMKTHLHKKWPEAKSILVEHVAERVVLILKTDGTSFHVLSSIEADIPYTRW